MDSPLVSIVMPAYNAEKYIEQSIESIINQTYQNWELIIIDDGSTDNTFQCTQRYLNDKVHAFKFANKGQSAQLNAGIALAKGKYIAIAHADDINELNRLELQVNYLDSNPNISICGTFIKTFNSKNEQKNINYPIESDNCYSALFYGNPLAHPTVMIRKALFIDHNLKYNEHLVAAEDYDLWIRLSKYAKIGNIPEVLVQYRLHEAQTSEIKKIEEEKIVNSSRLKLVKQLGENTSKKNVAIIYHFFYKSNRLSAYQQWKGLFQSQRQICRNSYMSSVNAKKFLFSILISNLKNTPIIPRFIHLFFMPLLIWHFNFNYFGKAVNNLFLNKSK